MSRRKMLYLISALVVVVLFVFGWRITARSAYESAAYDVVKSDGDFEVREYPDLKLAMTSSEFDAQGKDGSFMRLFRYIDGANQGAQKVAMTTPVFMEPEHDQVAGQMAFVLPQKYDSQTVPRPVSEAVQIQERKGGRFAVIRFSGRLNQETVKNAEAKLRDWASGAGLVCRNEVEYAGYDPPWTPGPFRRNEVLIRLKDETSSRQ